MAGMLSTQPPDEIGLVILGYIAIAIVAAVLLLREGRRDG